MLLPPATLSIIQVTLVFVVPTTVATKALKTPPVETVAVAGATVTLIEPFDPGLLLPTPPQPASKVSVKRKNNATGALNWFTTYTLSLCAQNNGAM